MKKLRRIFFCTFVITSFYSCNPEDVLEDEVIILPATSDDIGETGDQKGDIDDSKG